MASLGVLNLVKSNTVRLGFLFVCVLLGLGVAKAVDENSEGVSQSRAELGDNENVVLLGGTFFERSQRYGWLESELQARFPSRKLRFRNLGWSGDTVWAESRGIFEAPAQGYSKMVAQIVEIKPTVIVINYGANEAFEGPAGIGKFRTQYQRLLSDLSGVRPAIVLMTPHLHLRTHSQIDLSSVEECNRNILLYGDVVRELAKSSGASLIDLQSVDAKGGSAQVTDNGLHFNNLGNRLIARQVTDLWFGSTKTAIEIDSQLKSSAVGGSVGEVRRNGGVIQFQWTTAISVDAKTKLTLSGVEPGTYEIVVDGHVASKCTADELASGKVEFTPGSRVVAAYELLRQKVIEKDIAYFHRWRPQNVTYLFLFRKHEQGNNAKDVDEFEALTRKLDAEIYQLKQPVSQLIEIRRG